MAHDANAGKASKHWLWLLLLPWIAMVWVPSYNRAEPTLWDFPFFYWYQLLWVLLSALITGLVYHKTKHNNKPGAGGSNGGAK